MGRSASSALDVIGILSIGLTISVLSSGGKQTQALGINLDSGNPQTISNLALVVLAVFTLKGFTGIAFTAATTKLFASLEKQYAGELAGQYFTSNLSIVSSISRGQVTHALTSAIQASLGGILTPFSIFIAELSLLVYVLITFFAVNWQLAFMTLTYFMIIGFLIQQISGKFQKQSLAKMITDLQQSQNTLIGMIDAFREMFVGGSTEFYINQFVDRRQSQAKYAGLMTLLGVVPRYILEFALVVGLFIILNFNQLFFGSSASLAILGVFLAGAMRVVASMVPLQNSLSSMRSAGLEAEVAWGLEQLVGPEKEMTLENNIKDTISEAPLSVIATELSFSHKKGNQILNDLNLQVAPGSFVALIGPSGAGKTTLTDLLLGLLLPDSGNCTIDSIPSANFVRTFPGKVAYVPQRPGLIDGTLIENIALGEDLSKVDLNWIEKVIEMAHLEEVVSMLPEGIHSSVGQQKTALSGGQAQRLGLARAFYQRPKLLVLDEATSALDAISENKITDSIESLRGKVTVIVIAHRLSTVRSADKVFLIDQGQVKAEGKFDELVSKNPMVAEFVRLLNVSD